MFENEALFIGAVSNQEFAPFDNDNKGTVNLDNKENTKKSIEMQ